MIGSLAHLMYRHRWWVIAAWLVILIAAGSQAMQVNSILGPGDFTQKGSDSIKAAALLDKHLHENDNRTVLVLIASRAETVTSRAFRQTTATIERRIAADHGLRSPAIVNPLQAGNTQLIARDRHSLALTVATTLSEQKLEAQIDHLRTITRVPGYATYVLGTAAINHDYAIDSKNGLTRAETITVPILIVILLLIFGGLVAALLPLILAIFAIVLSLAAVYGFGHVLDTSIYVTDVVEFLGLGIAIDYSLFIVYRFRDELRRLDGNVEAAIVRAMETAGRAVFYSGLAVAVGLASLMLTGLSFMQSMGLGGMLVPISAVIAALTLLPALLGVIGPRVNSARVLPSRFLSTGGGGMWRSIAYGVMRRPVISGLVVGAALVLLAYQATGLAFSFGTLKNANHSLQSVRGYLYMQSHYNSTVDPVQVVIERNGPGSVLQPAQLRGIARLQEALARDPEVKAVVGPGTFLTAGTLPPTALKQVIGRYVSPDRRIAVIAAVPKDGVGTKQNEDMVRRYRTVTKRFEASDSLRGDAIYVGGAQAQYTDFNDAIYAHFPEIILLVLVLTYLFLFVAFRSVFLPLKAVLLNLLSVAASYGILQVVFQRGFLSGPMGFYPESGVASWVPIFLFAFLFGLSMDYEVFLLSRIREHWLATRNNRASVAFGLERTGRLITSAALIMIVAFSGFLIGHEIQLKEFGFGMLAAVAVDASLIRIVLVPSIMEIMGDWNWWVPGFLRDFAARGTSFDAEDTIPPDEEREAVGV